MKLFKVTVKYANIDERHYVAAETMEPVIKQFPDADSIKTHLEYISILKPEQ